MAAYSLYLHIPFCRHRCAYCDFNTYAGLDSLIEPYMQALIQEAGCFSGRVSTVFLGGGTPSLAPLQWLEQLLDCIRNAYELDPDAEITLEANPGTVSEAYLEGLRRVGFNRLSMGMQSAHPDDLRILEREHDFLDVVAAVEWARRAGFDNLNLDLIFGVPYQPFNRWAETLRRAVDLDPEHLSVYSLILEHGTPMEAWVGRGLLQAPDEDLAADMYEHTIEMLAGAGYLHYEISNWARSLGGKTLSCRHNLQYWRNQPYLGFGAGAHGFAGGYRTANVRAPQAYIQRMSQGAVRNFPRTPATINALKIDPETEMGETMMMGLRLVAEGISNQRFKQRFGLGIEAQFPGEVESLREQGLVEWVDQTLRLTGRGIRFGNRVFGAFV